MSTQIQFFKTMKELLFTDELPIAEALGMVANSVAGSPYQKVALQMKKDVFEKGLSLSIQMKKNEELFTPEVSKIFHAGEVSGKLKESIEKILLLIERQNAITKKLGMRLVD